MKNIFKWLATLLLATAFLPAHGAQTFGCLIEPYRVAEVGSQVVGIIESIKVHRGESVKKGQLIAILKAGVERASVGAANTRAKAEANVHATLASLEFDKERLKRAKELQGKNFISKQATDKIRAEHKVSEQKYHQARELRDIAKKDLRVASAQLSQRKILSPFDGVITDRYMTDGERIEEKPIVRLAKIDRLLVQVVVPVAFYGKIKPNDIATITPDFPDAPVVTGQATLIDKVIDAASNTFRVQVELPNEDLALPAGLRCRADFGLEPVARNHTEEPIEDVASFNNENDEQTR
ncbi:MAG: efflux RND transporter periplasmic adaptor subunit [Methylophilaceae bacterium]